MSVWVKGMQNKKEGKTQKIDVEFLPKIEEIKKVRNIWEPVFRLKEFAKEHVNSRFVFIRH